MVACLKVFDNDRVFALVMVSSMQILSSVLPIDASSEPMLTSEWQGNSLAGVVTLEESGVGPALDAVLVALLFKEYLSCFVSRHYQSTCFGTQ